MRRQSLIFVLCATGFASVSPNGVGTWEALAEPVAPQLSPLTMHEWFVRNKDEGLPVAGVARLQETTEPSEFWRIRLP